MRRIPRSAIAPQGHLRNFKAVLLIAMPLLASGCAVGPDFEKPAPPEVTGYTQQPLAATGSTNTAAARSNWTWAKISPPTGGRCFIRSP